MSKNKNLPMIPIWKRREDERVDNNAEKDVLNVIEAAALLRIHPVTLRKKAVEWGVPHRRLGSEWRFSKKMLLAWLQQQDAV
jgi:excisionase family DNA binding protein